MAEIKLEKFMVFDPKLSEEDKAEVQAAMEKHFVGAGQALIGQGRTELTGKFIELLRTGGSPERVDKLEREIKEMHGMGKFDRFRTQMLLVLIDAFQSGMYFALTEKAIENEWELAKILGFPTPKPTEKAG